MNAAELGRAMLEAKSEIDAALREYELRIHADAEADKLAKLAHASAYLRLGGTAGERNAYADKGSVDERYKARLADGLKRSARQRGRGRRSSGSPRCSPSPPRSAPRRSWRTGNPGRSNRREVRKPSGWGLRLVPGGLTLTR